MTMSFLIYTTIHRYTYINTQISPAKWATGVSAEHPTGLKWKSSNWAVTYQPSMINLEMGPGLE